VLQLARGDIGGQAFDESNKVNDVVRRFLIFTLYCAGSWIFATIDLVSIVPQVNLISFVAAVVAVQDDLFEF